MKKNSLDNLYKNMNLKDRAYIAFTAAMNDEFKTFKQITATVPIKYYSNLDAEYLSRIDALKMVYLHWGLDHWKLAFYWGFVQLMLIQSLKADNEDSTQIWRELTIDVHNQLVALETMLMTLKKEYGIEPGEICSFSGVNRRYSDNELIENMTDESSTYHDNKMKFYRELMGNTN